MKYILVFIMLNGDVYQTENGYESMQLCKENGMFAVLSLMYIHPERKVVEAYCKGSEKYHQQYKSKKTWRHVL